MSWNDLSGNWSSAWAGLRSRFPMLDNAGADAEPLSQEDLLHSIAARHDLTRAEAAEELQDWAFITSLARQATELGQD